MADQDQDQSRLRDRIRSDRDRDSEIIEAWFKGQGATVITVFYVLVGAVFIWWIWRDSPLLAAVIAAAAIGAIVTKQRGML